MGTTSELIEVRISVGWDVNVFATGEAGEMALYRPDLVQEPQWIDGHLDRLKPLLGVGIEIR